MNNKISDIMSLEKKHISESSDSLKPLTRLMIPWKEINQIVSIQSFITAEIS